MHGVSGSSQTRLGARLGARNLKIVSEFRGVEPLLAGVSNGMEPFGQRMAAAASRVQPIREEWC